MVKSEDKDMRLGEKIKQEIPNIIQKCVKAYLELVNEHSSHEFWKFCPKYFNETKEELQSISNVMQSFMTSDEIILEKSGLVLEKDFLDRLRKYAESRGLRLSTGSIKNHKFSINSVIQQVNDRYDDAEITYQRRNNVTIKDKKYNKVMVLEGIRLRQEEDANTELYHNDETPKKLFAFENDFEIQNQLNKLYDQLQNPENAPSDTEMILNENADIDIMKNDKNDGKELIDIDIPSQRNQNTSLNVDVEYSIKDAF